MDLSIPEKKRRGGESQHKSLHKSTKQGKFEPHYLEEQPLKLEG
jgi:hypothetical protein